MLGYYVIMVATLGMTVTAGMTILVSATAGEQMAQASRDAQALLQAEAALHQTLVFDAEGGVFAPMGEMADGRTGLPGWVISQNFAPSSGVTFGYCPYAVQPAPDPEALISDDIRGKSGTKTYTVGLRERPARGGMMRTFVEKGGRSAHKLDSGTPPDVVAFIISPSRGGDVMADCDQIYWDGMRWRVEATDTPNNGVVRAITRDSVTRDMAGSDRVMRRTVARGGTGDGGRRDEPGLLARAFSEWRAVRPARMTIEILREADTTATFDLSQNDLDMLGGADAPASAQLGRSLHLEALDGAGDVVLRAVDPATGAALVHADLHATTDLTARGIDFGKQITLHVKAGARLVLQDVILHRLVIDGGDVVIRGTTRIGNTDLAVPAIVAHGGSLSQPDGTLTVLTKAGVAGGLELDGARLRVDGTLQVATGGPSAIFVPDLPFMATYGAAGRAMLGPNDQTASSATRMQASEISGLIRSALGSQTCTTADPGSLCRRTASCSGIVVEGNCETSSGALRLMSMRTIRTSETDAYLECTWRNTLSPEDAAPVSAQATATCLPIKTTADTTATDAAGTGG